MENEFYLQDSRSYVGNDVSWWAKDHGGYTCDISNAHVFTREEALRYNQQRPSDKPWPKGYIDARTRPVVDVQYIRQKEALEESGIEWVEPPKPKRKPLKCGGCGQFVTARDYHFDDHNCRTNSLL